MGDGPKTMDGYIRVSRVAGREGAGYISPKIQRESIERWATFRKIEITAWHVDEDESGGTQDRPGIREAIRRVEAGETEGIACWRLNRFARNVSAAIDDVKRIEAAGGHLAFVEENIDPVGPFGSFLLTVLLAVATLERDNLSSGWRSAKTRAVARGLKIGKAPLGYEKGKDGRLRKSADASKVVEAFRLAGGSGVAATTAFLRSQYPGRVWTVSTTRRLLSSHTYLGQITYGDLVNTTAHEPLVTRAEWEAAQHTGRQRKTASMDYPLSGIATCAGCQRPMVGSKSNEERVYRCKYGQTRDGENKCPSPAVISANRLEPYVREALRRVWLEEAFQTSEETPEDVAAAQTALEDAEAELYAFAEDTTLRKALGSAYQELLDARVAAVDEAKEAFRQKAQEVEHEKRVLPRELIDTDDPELLRDLLGAAFKKIEVIRGRGTVSDRTRLFLYGSDVPMPPPQIP